MQGLSQGFDANSAQKADLSPVAALGKEALHGRKCDVYGTSDKRAVAQALQSAATMGASSGDLVSVDAAELKLWVCDDGYFHQMSASIDGTAKDPPAQKFSVRIRASFFDFNGTFTIAAPPNAAKLEQPTGSVFQTVPSSGASARTPPRAPSPCHGEGEFDSRGARPRLIVSH
jgi:hypothetical protein